jgi:hypothetical protein
LNEIVELHEELLGELHRAVPHSEYTQLNCVDDSLSPTCSGHQRWRSLDAVPEHAGDASWLQKVPGMTAEPKVAAAVAKVFNRKVKAFWIHVESRQVTYGFADESFLHL